MTIDYAELVRIALAAAYAIFALVLWSIPNRTLVQYLLIGVSIMASAVTFYNSFGHRISPWPATLALIFVVVLINGTIAHRRRNGRS